MKPKANELGSKRGWMVRPAVRSTALKAVLLGLFLAGFAWAEDDDQPGRGVARVSVVQGDVSVRRGDSGDWVAAAVNAPLVVEDTVHTGPSSRAEVQFDWANMVRLAAQSEIRLKELEHERYQFQVGRGTVILRVLRDSNADVEISTPSVSVRPLKRGAYRVTVREDGATEITARSGEAEIYTPRGVERLKSGRTMLARGTAADPEFQIVSEVAWDNFDRWNEDRDRYLARTRSYRYVHRSVYGADELDYYGDWDYVAPYGWIWAPRVAVGWAPYHYGRWAWIDWYGWSWVSYDPWGWAPFHYGRWFYHGHRWCWWPGGYYTHHHWRPALVAFFGWGHGGFNLGFGLNWGHVGWVPLAPYEPYHPWYGWGHYRGYHRTTYIDNSVNIVNNTNITNIYKNARVGNAIAAVNASEFGRGTGNLVRVNRTDIERVGLVKGQLPFVPGRESLRMGDREVRAGTLPRSLPEGRFYSRREPARVERVPFEDQRRSIERIARGTPEQPSVRAGDTARTPAPESPRGGVARGAEGNLPRVGGEDRGGWRRFGEPVARPGTGGEAGLPRATERGREGAVRTLPESPRESEGWRRMGEPRRETAPSEGGGWRRFGEPVRDRPGGLIRREESQRSVERAPVEAAPRSDGNIRRNEPGGDWRRFESRDSDRGPSRPEVFERRSEPRDELRYERRSEYPRYESPRFDRSDSPRWEPRGGGEDRIRISPPMVRERESPRYQAPRMDRAPESRGGGRFEAPHGGGEVRSMPRGDSGGGRSMPRGDGGSGRVSGGDRGGRHR